MYSKQDVMEFEQAWKLFDKSTAYGCHLKGNEFNSTMCKFYWKEYQKQYIKRGMSPPILEGY